MIKSKSAPLVKSGMAILPLAGQKESGDLYLVKTLPNKSVLVGVVDGLGHGEEAATAARIAVNALKTCADDSLINMVQYCHESLKRTRGVVMSLAVFNGENNTMTWTGIGNIEAVLFRANSTCPIRNDSSGGNKDRQTGMGTLGGNISNGLGSPAKIATASSEKSKPIYESLFLRSGVIGYQLPPLRTSILPVTPDDILIFATDGINSNFKESINQDEMPKDIANHILKHYSKGTDDALVLVVRYQGRKI